MEEIEIKKLDPEAILPVRAHPEDAGMDLHCVEEFILAPRSGRVAKTGIALSIPRGYVGMIADRSSMAKKGVKTAGGIVDSGYRGEVGVVLWNLSNEDIKISRGDRIAQMLILPIATPKPFEVENLTDTLRGSGGFGSTGR